MIGVIYSAILSGVTLRGVEWTVSLPSLIRCAVLCETLQECKNFAFDRSQGECYPLRHRLVNYDSKGTAKYFERIGMYQDG